MIADDVALETGVRVFHPTLVNLYGRTIGAGTTMGPFVEIQRGASIGRSCRISSHSFICDGVAIEDGVFVGHGVKFTNDLYPRAVNDDATLKGPGDWTLIKTRV